MVRARNRTPAERRRATLRWAAGILLAVGLSGVAYAAPGSPLRSVINRIVEWIRPQASPVPETIIPTAPAGGGGVLMDPGNGVVIELRSLQPFDSLVVFLNDEQQVAVRAQGGSVTFLSDVGRLGVSNASGVARIEVAIPRGAPRVEIVTGGGRQLYLKSGSAITSTATDTTGGRHVIVPARR